MAKPFDPDRAQPDRSDLLRQLMRTAGVSSFKALSQRAGISEHQVDLLRQGAIARVRLETLLNLSALFQVEVGEFLAIFQGQGMLGEGHQPIGGDRASPVSTSQSPAHQALQQEYNRLQAQLDEQRATLQQEFQQSSLQILESLILQLPTAAYAAQQNPQAPAIKLLPLLTPIERLLAAWGITAIAPVGAILPYDPHYHQLLEGQAQMGDRVKVRYTGYLQDTTLLYRARVSPVPVDTDAGDFSKSPAS